MPLTAGRSPPAVHGRRTIYGGVLFFVLFRPAPYIVRLRWRSEPPARCLKSVRRIGRLWTGGIAGGSLPIGGWGIADGAASVWPAAVGRWAEVAGRHGVRGMYVFCRSVSRSS